MSYPPAPMPAPVPQPPAPAPAPAPAAPPAPAPVPSPGAPALNEFGFPPNTPVEQMAPEHQAAYWKHQSRRHEERIKNSNLDELQRQAAELERLRASTQTEQERAIAAAKAEGRTEALRQAGRQLVDAHFAAALPGMPEQDRQELLAGIDRGHFLGADGTTVDTNKIASYAARLTPAAPTTAPPVPGAPAPAPGPASAPAPRVDTGQGGGAGPAPVSGLAAGAEMARRRHGITPQGASTT